MQTKAQLRYLRIAPRKVRLVVDMIRGKSVDKAQHILSFTTKKAANPVLKLLNSAVANAKNNLKLNTTNLFISKIEVNEGPKLKRWRPRARGRAYEIQKKTSHIIMILDEVQEKKKVAKKTKKTGKTKKHES